MYFISVSSLGITEEWFIVLTFSSYLKKKKKKHKFLKMFNILLSQAK